MTEMMDAFEIIPNIADEPGVVIYLDPPYIEKSDDYLHDFKTGGLFQACDHDRLAEMLRKFRQARIIVSYYDHPKVRGLYKGWTFRDCSRAKHLANQGPNRGAQEGVAPEFLILTQVSKPPHDAGKECYGEDSGSHAVRPDRVPADQQPGAEGAAARRQDEEVAGGPPRGGRQARRVLALRAREVEQAQRRVRRGRPQAPRRAQGARRGDERPPGDDLPRRPGRAVPRREHLQQPRRG